MATLAVPPKGEIKPEPAAPPAGHQVVDMEKQRKLAKERAKKKAEGRTAAKRQQAAERIAASTEALASGIGGR